MARIIILKGVFGSRERQIKGKKMGEKEEAGKLPPALSITEVK